MRIAPEDKSAKLRPGDDIDRAVLVQIGRQDCRAHAGVVVHELRDKTCPAGGLRIADRLVPVEDRRTERIGIKIIRVVRPVPLPHNEVRDAVTPERAHAAFDETTLQVFWMRWPSVSLWAGSLWRMLSEEMGGPATPHRDADHDEVGGSD